MGSIVMNFLIKMVPDCLCNRIKLFKEEYMDIRQMDRSWTSQIRRRSSLRLNFQSQLNQEAQKQEKIEEQKNTKQTQENKFN